MKNLNFQLQNVWQSMSWKSGMEPEKDGTILIEQITEFFSRANRKNKRPKILAVF